MKKTLTPAGRLIVAADFKPVAHNGKDWVKAQVLKLADNLKGTGVYLKVNSALRACGYDLIGEIQSRGLQVFADLKLFDIGETLSTDGVLLREAKPEILTTVCSAGALAMKALKTELPDTEVLGVTVLTSLAEQEVFAIHGLDKISDVAYNLALIGLSAGIDGFVSSAAEAVMLRDLVGDTMTINTPGIRPAWANVVGDDQNQKRVKTPGDAIKVGADRIVVGRPILLADNPYDAVMRTIDEIASAVA